MSSELLLCVRYLYRGLFNLGSNPEGLILLLSFFVVITNKKIENHRDEEEWREVKQRQGQNWWSCSLWG